MENEFNSSCLIKKLIDGKDIKRWHARPKDMWLINIPKGWTRSQIELLGEEVTTEEYAEKWFSNQYPQLFSWLAKHKERCVKRSDKGEFWWELRSCAYNENFEESKISFVEIANSNPFFMDNAGFYNNATAFFIPTNDYYLLAVLNSKVVWLYWQGICTFLRGGYLRLKSQFLNTTPIPDKPADEKLSILAKECQTIVEARYKC